MHSICCICADLSISQPVIYTSGALITNSNGNYAFSVTLNVTVMSESFVSIVGESLFLNGAQLSSGM